MSRNGKELVPDEARPCVDYDLTLCEITRRLKNADKQDNDGENCEDTNAQP